MREREREPERGEFFASVEHFTFSRGRIHLSITFKKRIFCRVVIFDGTYEFDINSTQNL
jgi:hypothetical protein